VASVAEQNRTFYAYDTASPDLIELFEQPFPPLDHAQEGKSPEYRGVSILASHVHVSKPTDWILRSAGNEPGKRFVQYLSPKEYLFAVYEWPDHGDAPWREVLGRYEEAVKASKAEIVEWRIPMATYNTQVRAYRVRRKVPAAKAPLVNMSFELLARSERRIVLVQVVHQGDDVVPLADDLLRVVETLRVD
jgi:hypothetical protein